jgi:hypothetical protein
MNQLNALLTPLADWLFAPFTSMPLAGLLFWSAVTGVIMTYVFGKTSNQVALRRAADRTRAQLLAVKLFKDDLAVTLQCQVALMKATAMRLWHSLRPTIVMMPPLILVLTQLALRYEFRPLQAGERALVDLQLAPDAWEQYQNVELAAADGVVIETPSLRDAHTQSLQWRIRAESDRSTKLRWEFGDRQIEKDLSLAPGADRLQPTNSRRAGPGFWDRLLYPGEPGFNADSPVQSISVQYAARHTPLLGMDIPWWGTFFIVSMLVALVAGRFLGVQF